MEDLVGITGIIALGMKLVSFVKFLVNRDWNAAVTQLAVWAAGVVSVFLAAAANVVRGFEVGGVSLASFNAASKVFVGMSLLSIGSVVYDFRKARDASDSAAEPSLLQPFSRIRRPFP